MNGSPLLSIDPTIVGVIIALGIGLLIGAERERRKGEGGERGAAGIRTFALAALLGALSRLFGDNWLLAASVLAAAALAVVSYARSQKDDPGLTSEVALLVTVLLGGLALEHPSLAGALGVAVAALLAIRMPLHRFIREALTSDEMRDALILAIATFVIWPLVPAAPIGPFNALNLHSVWLVVIMVMSIGAIGHVAVRIAGARLGIPVAGFFSGFISSTATIGALSARAAREPAQLNAVVAGAVLSSVATLVQMSLLLLAIDATVLRTLVAPLLFAGAAAALYAAYFVVIALRTPTAAPETSGRAFSIVGALVFGALICTVLVASAALDHWFGARGALAGAAVAGFVDVHAATVSTATLAANGVLRPEGAALPIIVGFTANTVSKVVMAFSGGNGAFAGRVTAGLALIAAAAWIGLLLAGA